MCWTVSPIHQSSCFATQKKAATPRIDDHQLPKDDFVTVGFLCSVAAQIDLYMLKIVRIATPDILWTANTLGRAAAKWNKTCENRSERLINYNHFTSGYCQPCPLGDYAKNCKLGLHLKLAGLNIRVSRYVVHSLGERTFVRISWMCREATAVSHSSTEAEICPRMLDHLWKLTLLGLWLIPSRWKRREANSHCAPSHSELPSVHCVCIHSLHLRRGDIDANRKFHCLKPNRWDLPVNSNLSWKEE